MTSRGFTALSVLAPLALLLTGVAAPPHTNASLNIRLDRPGDRDFVLDKAGLLTETDKAKVHAICDKLLTDTGIPIIVVTIESMAKYGPENIRIETYAQLLFDQWGIGLAQYRGSSWNRGILLLIAAEDRKARIELGADWGHEFDGVTQRIMDQRIIFRFKQGDYSTGIVEGVEALDKMARGQRLPMPPQPWWHYALGMAAMGLMIFTIISLIRRGMSGWAWLFWGALFGVIGYVLYSMLSNAGQSSGGGFSGGSFGGGFSGGGGATGSW